jgi:DNA mismatch repair protein MutS2
VVGAAFGFNPETFAPTYRLVYGSPGRSLAIEIAARLGMPPAVVAAARGNLTERERQLADHLARVDSDLRKLEQERRAVGRDRLALVDAERKLQAREGAVREREEASRTRLSAKLDAQVRDARREIDAVIDGLKARVAELTEKATRSATAVNTGVAGAARAEAREALEAAVQRVRSGADSVSAPADLSMPPAAAAALAPGARVSVGALGLEGVVLELHGRHAEVDVRGKRLRTPLRDLRVIAGPAPPAAVRVNVDLQPREGSRSELNVIGCTVDEALTRAEKFLDESTVTDQRVLRLIHGHGTGQLRRALKKFLQEHPLVARFEQAPLDQGGGGVTVVELKD